MADIELVIKIPEDVRIAISRMGLLRIPDEMLKKVDKAIQRGTPIPNNATNGEIMQMMFPNGVTAEFATFMRFVVGEDEYINCAYDWWNAPYQKGGKE